MTTTSLDRTRSSSTTMSTNEAWLRVATHHEGRLHHQTGSGARQAVLPYRADRRSGHEGVWLRIPDLAPAAHSTIGRVVAFEVDGQAADGSHWVARIAGTAVDGGLHHPDELLTVPATLSCRWVFVPAAVIEGRRRP